jgi:hypothetical protein
VAGSLIVDALAQRAFQSNHNKFSPTEMAAVPSVHHRKTALRIAVVMTRNRKYIPPLS